MFIGDVLILLLLGGVWYRWENSSEKAAQDLSRQRYIQDEYYGTAEPPVRCGESHLSGLTEPLRSL